MATEAKFNTEDDEDKAPNTSLGGPSAAPASGGAAPQGRPTTPSGRPNVQQYLQANQGAGQKLQGAIEKNVGNQANQLNRNIDEGRNKLEAGSRPLEQKLGQEGSQFAQTSFKDPQALLSQQNQLDEFRRLQQGGYNQNINELGQQTTSSQQDLQNQYNKLNERVGQAGSETGRFDLLRSSLGQPNYSRGQQRLDQLFLQAQPGVNRNLQTNLQGVGNQAQQQVGGFGTDAQARLNALQGLSTSRADEIAKLLKGGTEEGLESDISGRGLEDIGISSQQRLAQAQEAVNAVPGLRERLAQNQLTDADLQALGLNQGTQLYDTDLSKYISQDQRTPTIAGSASPEEFARYRALQQLSGDTSGDIFGGATEVGGFRPYDYDQDRLQQGIEQQRHYNEVERVDQMRQTLGQIAPALVNNVHNADDLKQQMLNYVRGLSHDPNAQVGGAAWQHYITNSTGPRGWSQFEQLLNDIDRSRGRSINQVQAPIANLSDTFGVT